MRFKELIKYASHKRKEAEKESVVAVAYWNGYLEALDDALNEVQCGWTSVKDGLPKKRGRYLVICETIPSPVVRNFNKEFISLQEVTHWMPFPALPNECGEEHIVTDCIDFDRQAMNRDKQVWEMCNDLSEGDEEFRTYCRGRQCQECEYYFAKTDCKNRILAENLVDKGYSNDSYIVREIFAELDELLYPYRSHIKTIDIHEYNELKRKYMRTKRTEEEG